MHRHKRAWPEPYLVYLAAISGLGLLLVAQGLLQIPSYDDPVSFLLLIALAAVAQITSTSLPISQTTDISIAVGSAVIIAVIPSYGPFGAAVASAVGAAAIWLMTPTDRRRWKKTIPQLAFNTGMQSIAMFMAGLAYLATANWLGPQTWLGLTIPWLVAAITDDQVNFWLLMGILRLQQGRAFEAREFWKANVWSLPISITVASVGGGVLAYAFDQFGRIGILVFFLPIVLSAYSFRLYVRQMQAHMDNLENIVAERTHELAAVNREKDAFLAVLTHDMKTPLTSIGLYASLIQSHPQLVAEKPHMTEIIMRSQKTLLDIVNNILDLEHLQSGGKMPIRPETFDLNSLIEYTVETVKPQAQDKEIGIEIGLESPAIPLKADRQQIERVLMNLISNAIKYTPNSGQVCVKARRNGESVFLDVIDTGYGIPSEELPHIFERFRRVNKHKDKAVGTGLGLAITKALVEAHGGTISVSSQEEVGTTFTVQLPLKSQGDGQFLD